MVPVVELVVAVVVVVISFALTCRAAVCVSAAGVVACRAADCVSSSLPAPGVVPAAVVALLTKTSRAAGAASAASFEAPSW